MPATLTFYDHPSDALAGETLVFVGRRARLLGEQVCGLLPPGLSTALWTEMVKSAEPGDQGRLTSTWLEGTPRRVVAAVLPEVCSRHNAPSRAWAIPRLAAAAGRKGSVGFLLAVDAPAHALSSCLALGRAHPKFSATSKQVRREVRASVLSPRGQVLPAAQLQVVVDASRLAADLVDRPPNLLTTTALVAEAETIAGRHDPVDLQVYRGRELERMGLGGLWGVGKASQHPPALVVLDYAPAEPKRKTVWVGKGIVYDTGGLSLKPKTGMPGMKNDMGGAAAVLAAFEAAVKLGVRERLTAVLCIAENSIGQEATRPDDVLKIFSGRTVEVNNTDAEGRLVLADGVAWAVRHRKPDRLIDMATLTGAQSVATGKRMAALYASTASIEQEAVTAGREVGELCHPLPYVPEFFRMEFTSTIADMRNSVKDRANAQASCAGQFIGNHLGPYKGEWLHIDMAGPVVAFGRGTGFGVGLLLALTGVGPTRR